MLSVFVRTFNEELNLRRLLDSLKGISDDVHIVDSGSADRTLEIAKEYDFVHCHGHEFKDFSSQWRWGIDNLPFKHEWIFMPDADYQVSPTLAYELKKFFGSGRDRELDGMYIRWVYFFRGKRMRFGSHTPRYKFFLFKKDAVYLNQNELVDVHLFLKPGKKYGYIRAPIFEDNRKEMDILFWFQKHVHYTSWAAREELNWRSGRNKTEFAGLPTKNILRLQSLYHRMPLYIRPWFYFLYDYVVRLGFLHGKEGFILHFFRILCYRMLVDAILDSEKNVKNEK